jgi:hypothetical protein
MLTVFDFKSHKRPGAWGLASWGVPQALETEVPVNLLFTDSRSSFLFISCQMQQQNSPPRERRERPAPRRAKLIFKSGSSGALKLPNGTVSWHHCIIIPEDGYKTDFRRTSHMHYHSLEAESTFSRSHGTSLATTSLIQMSRRKLHGYTGKYTTSTPHRPRTKMV